MATTTLSSPVTDLFRPLEVYFIKDCAIVGATTARLNTIIPELGLYREISLAMRRVFKRFSIEYIKTVETNGGLLKLGHEESSKYFTTKDALHEFNYMILGDYIIPSAVAWSVFKDVMSPKEWSNTYNRFRMMTSETKDILREYLNDCEIRSGNVPKVRIADTPDVQAGPVVSGDGKLKHHILEAIKSFGSKGCIGDDVEDALQNVKPWSISPRYKELINDGSIYDTGEKRIGRSGRKQRVLKARGF